MIVALNTVAAILGETTDGLDAEVLCCSLLGSTASGQGPLHMLGGPFENSGFWLDVAAQS